MDPKSISDTDPNLERILDQLREIDIKLNRHDNRFSALEDAVAHQTSKESNLLRHKISIVGVEEAFEARRVSLKIIWALLILFGIGATFYFLYETTDEYLKTPTATIVHLEKEADLHFAPMLLCPEIWYNVETAISLGLSRDPLKYSLTYAAAESIEFRNHVKNVPAARQEFLDVYFKHKFRSLLDYYKAISLDLDPSDGNEGNHTYGGCAGCYDPRPNKTMLDGRLCYVFDFKPIERGIGMYLTDHRVVYLVYRARTMGLFPESPDWYLYFNPQPQLFLSVYPKLSIRAPYYSEVNFNMQRFIALDKPDDPCVQDKNYSSAACMATCQNSMYMDDLNCSLLRFSNVSSNVQPWNTCNSMDQWEYDGRNWTLPQYMGSWKNARVEATAADQCVKMCPRECDRIVLETTINQHGAMWWAVENPNVTFIWLQVKHGSAYSRGVMVVKEVSTYSLAQWVTNIGGTLGLFVGSTLMTFAQLIIFAVEFCGLKIRGGNRQ